MDILTLGLKEAKDGICFELDTVYGWYLRSVCIVSVNQDQAGGEGEHCPLSTGIKHISGGPGWQSHRTKH